MKIKTYDKIIKFFKDKRRKKLEKLLREIRKNAHKNYIVYFEEFHK